MHDNLSVQYRTLKNGEDGKRREGQRDRERQIDRERDREGGGSTSLVLAAQRFKLGTEAA